MCWNGEGVFDAGPAAVTVGGATGGAYSLSAIGKETLRLRFVRDGRVRGVRRGD